MVQRPTKPLAMSARMHHPRSPKHYSPTHRSQSSLPLPPHEKHPYATLPVLFWVGLTLVILSCLQSPSRTDQFTTNRNSLPQSRNGDSPLQFAGFRPSMQWLNPNLVASLKIVPSGVVTLIKFCERDLVTGLEYLARTVSDFNWGVPRGRGIVRRVGVSALYNEDPSRAQLPSYQGQQSTFDQKSSPVEQEQQEQQAQQEQQKQQEQQEQQEQQQPQQLLHHQQHQQQQPFLPPPILSPSPPISSFMSDEQSVRLLPGRHLQNVMFGFAFGLGVLLIVMVFSEVL